MHKTEKYNNFYMRQPDSKDEHLQQNIYSIVHWLILT